MSTPSFTYDWTSQNIPLFNETLGHLKGQPNLRALEVGSFEGRSALWFCENILTHSSSRLTCIDTFKGSDEHSGIMLASLRQVFDVNTRGHAHKLAVAEGLSRNILPQLVDNYFDFIYIDGSHWAHDVLLDGLLAWHKLKPGGWLIFDDYKWKHPARTSTEQPEEGIQAFINVHMGHITEHKQAYAYALRKL